MSDARDIRLYIYTPGQLIKSSTRKAEHNFDSVEECKTFIGSEKIRRLKYNPRAKQLQYVIAEYFDTYRSKIIEIV